MQPLPCNVQLFRFDAISSGIRLSMMSGPYPSSISVSTLVGAAYVEASKRGGRLEISAIAPWRSLVRRLISRISDTRRLVGKHEGIDVYLIGSSRKRREKAWRARARQEILAAASKT